MCGFSRRFDASYRAAYIQTADGSIGRPTILRSQTCDMVPQDWEFFVEYAQFSDGIFVDCNIHDIDLALWFFGMDSAGRVLPKLKSVVAFGVTALQPKLAQYGDVDNGVGVVEFYCGQIVYFYSPRINQPGRHDMTEIVGTKGKLTVNANPANGLLESHLPIGVQRDIPHSYYERFEHAFITEAQEFTETVLENRDMPVDLQSSYEAVRIDVALQKSLRSQEKIFFDHEGSRIDKACVRL
jgi:myo-inositol 2-dehydrogenase/D-chiro-inositol 1-dehydrogenase